QLGAYLVVLLGPLDRVSHALVVLHLPTRAERLAWLAEVIPQLPGTGIIYTLTVADARTVAAWLKRCGIDCAAYTGDEPTESKLAIEARLAANELKCVAATSALGMGYDKPDLAFVVHFQVPGSAVAYYQQVGRAGRGLDRALAIALVGAEDVRIQDYFIRTAFPEREQAEAVIEVIAESGDWVKLAEIEQRVNLRRSRLTNMLKILEVEGVVERTGFRYRRTLRPWKYPTERLELVTAQRRAEQDRMQDYLVTSDCLMDFLRRELDDPTSTPCGRCARCLGAALIPVVVDRARAAEAVAFLRSESFELEPRKQWPDQRRIAAELRAEPGVVLSMFGDGGWGSLVQEQRQEGIFGDELVRALVTLLGKQRFEHRPEWVTCVPSRREPDLVPTLAERVAAALRLPFLPVVAKTRMTEPQRLMENSAQQFANVDGAFAISGPVPSGPVLLIDDLIDSRWTLTVVGALLRQNGSGPVVPAVLARAMSD
ncbi:MAG: helicase-related protein, partial [Actinomycetota bacterium]